MRRSPRCANCSLHAVCLVSAAAAVCSIVKRARDLLELILYAVLDADDDRAVRGALSTRLLGATFAVFVFWQADAQAFERELERFQSWRKSGACSRRARSDQCFARTFAAHIYTAADGERNITDLRHLGESAGRGGGRAVRTRWVVCVVRCCREGGDGDTDATDARQLRIESDSRRVQLLTVHTSKGLEFPIVFLPLAWRTTHRSGPRKPKVLRFHDEDGYACVDLGSANFAANRAPHFREDLQERLRLLYVALTCAVHAVHVYWVDRGESGDADEDSWKVAAIDILIREAQQAVGPTSGEAALDDMAQKLGGIAIVDSFAGNSVAYIEPAHPDVPRAARKPLPALRAFQWLHSFSSLSRQAKASGEESAAADEIDIEPLAGVELDDVRAIDVSEAEDLRLLALHALSGPRFGDAVHNVLERARPWAASGPSSALFW